MGSYFPQPVKLDVIAFVKTDREDNQHAFILTKGQYLQGVFARYDQESRVYVVSIQTSLKDNIFSSWPRVLSGVA